MLDTETLFRLKAAQHDLIVRAGGIERAAALVSSSTSTVGRWNSRNHPDMMPLAAVVILERETGVCFVTKALASIAGLEVQPRASAEQSLMRNYVDTSRAASELAATTADAMADGVVTPAEQSLIDARASNLSQAVDNLRGSIASSSNKVVKLG